jgi:hypothetical protein
LYSGAAACKIGDGEATGAVLPSSRLKIRMAPSSPKQSAIACNASGYRDGAAAAANAIGSGPVRGRLRIDAA